MNTPLNAQSIFSTVAQVNYDVVTAYEVDQRAKFFKFIRRPGNPNQDALETLIEDRLKMQAVRQVGLEISPEGMRNSMEEFAQRANISLDEFTIALAQDGIDQSTLRDFVVPAVSWRELIRTRFARQAQVSEAEIDRALNSAGPNGGLRVLLSEIVLFAPPQDFDAQMATARRLAAIKSIAEFSEQARQLSVANSAPQGGRMTWVNVRDLPPPLQPVLSALRPGEVSQPLEAQNAIVLFQLRDIAETAPPKRQVTAVEYAQMIVPSDQVGALTASVDVCDDFYGIAQITGNGSLTIETLPIANVPQALAIQLATLDPSEITYVETAPGLTTLTMLCGRSYEATNADSREATANALRNRRLTSLADGYLAEVRASANIVIK